MLEMRSKLFMPVPGGRSRLNPIRTQMKGYLLAGDHALAAHDEC
jgi:hypothetical protein